jgi:hypothetical protein
MTPKEKAKELVNKLFEFNQKVKWDSDNNEWTHDYYQAKQCALIAVNEIINTHLLSEKDIFGIHPVYYWEEVKQEIEKL